jgi:LacI family transcriptional regulator
MARPTIRDVAKVAGVSIKTVSRVTNDDGDVALKTAARVKEAIVALGYQPNPLARSLRTGRDEAIGLVVETLADPFFAAVSDAVEEVARDAGLFLIISGAGRTADEERAVVRGLLHRSLQGLLIVPCKLDYGAERLPIGPGGVPVVFVDRPSSLDVDTVLVDNAEVARTAVAHLIGHGHRRIAFIGTQIARYTVGRRFEGYQVALRDAGIDVDSQLVVSHPEVIPKGGALGGVLDLSDPATAVFTANAVASIAVVSHLHRAARTDIAMVSFDDFPIADAVTPAISVADQDPIAMGRQAFDALRRRIEGDTAPARQILVPMEFVARGSGELSPLTAPMLRSAKARRAPVPAGVRARRTSTPSPPKTGEPHV